jgi:cleavage stimulation factor subunit 3
MRFARRAEGIKSARLVFKRSRQDPRCSSHVFVAAALMEYYCTKDKNIAFKIFDLGLKRFKHQPDYLLAYVEFLTQLNEDNNTRVLFERILSSGSLTSENSLEIWNRFLEFESSIGDLSSVIKVEKRRNAVLDKVFFSFSVGYFWIHLNCVIYFSLRNLKVKKQHFSLIGIDLEPFSLAQPRI